MTSGETEGEVLDLAKIAVEPKPSVDARKKAEKVVQAEARDYSRRAKKLHEDGLEHDLDARKKYGPWLFKLVVAWLFLVLATVWASAVTVTLPSRWQPWWSEWMPTLAKFDLSDTVLIALVTGATVNVIGLLYAVVKYTFPSRGEK